MVAYAIVMWVLILGPAVYLGFGALSRSAKRPTRRQQEAAQREEWRLEDERRILDPDDPYNG